MSNRTSLLCLQCGRAFLAYPSEIARGRQFCSRSCKSLHYQAQQRKEHPVKLCRICQQPVQDKPSRMVARAFCSRACYGWSKIVDKEGLTSRRVTTHCQQCGTEVIRKPWERNRRFCSRQCWAQFRSLHLPKERVAC